MKTGIWKANGLAAEFELLYQHPNAPTVFRVRTAAGENYAYGHELTWGNNCARRDPNLDWWEDRPDLGTGNIFKS